MYKYETHLHTYPVSKCARSTVRENLELYKEFGYDGVFITNHFLDGNINIDYNTPYEEKINFYFSDYEEAKKLEDEIGIKVFCGVELTYKGTDFLIYGLDKEWYLSHPEIMDMKKSDELPFMMENGALVIQAHPYREAAYIDHIRLFPRHVHGVEIINACRSEHENNMAKAYADSYELIEFAGTDNHTAGNRQTFAGMCSVSPIVDENDFVNRVKNGEMKVFSMNTEKKD
ncbi:MAG: histidinol-phosphatase [Clostridia bacterium]|nr:histidinol-phosphatase [Clostridia bacterium]